jgi:hypothetical protein
MKRSRYHRHSDGLALSIIYLATTKQRPAFAHEAPSMNSRKNLGSENK